MTSTMRPERQAQLTGVPTAGGAVFSPCRKYRYFLQRRWDFSEGSQSVAFIGVNPSTADESRNDPTIRRCIQFAKDWGFGGLFMLNLFAFRATDPADMKAVDDPVGPQNNVALLIECRKAAKVVAAWGVHGVYQDRAKFVMERVIDVPVWCLGVTKDGHPKHPLYIRADQPLVPFGAGRN